MSETDLREAIICHARSLFERAITPGPSGNISVRTGDGILITPTNSKEVFLHRAFYNTREAAGAVVHLHPPHATALSCLERVDPADCIPPITPYVVMRVEAVPLLPYVGPGAAEMGDLAAGGAVDGPGGAPPRCGAGRGTAVGLRCAALNRCPAGSRGGAELQDRRARRNHRMKAA